MIDNKGAEQLSASDQGKKIGVTREQLLEVATHQLEQHGPHSLSVRRIAEAAGCSTMVLYTTFGSKEGLVEALYLEGFRQLGEKVGNAPLESDPRTCAMNQFAAYRAFAHSHPHVYALMFQKAVADFEPTLEARELGWRAISAVVEVVAQCLEQGLFDAPSADEGAAQLWAAAHGVVSLELAGNLPDEAAGERIYRAVVAKLISG
jgi:AcrR family transcriptional regulator